MAKKRRAADKSAQGLEQKNLVLELLRKLLQDEVKARAHTNLVQARSFEQLLQEAHLASV